MEGRQARNSGRPPQSRQSGFPLCGGSCGGRVVWSRSGSIQCRRCHQCYHQGCSGLGAWVCHSCEEGGGEEGDGPSQARVKMEVEEDDQNYPGQFTPAEASESCDYETYGTVETRGEESYSDAIPWEIFSIKLEGGRRGKKLCVCDTCDYRATCTANLTRHKRKHTGEKPYACGECDYRTAHASGLSVHKRTHTGEKPHRCDECDYSSTQACNLTAHKRTHTGERRYECDTCDYRATCASNLIAHKLTHTDDKPHECDKCDYRSRTKSNLTRHKRMHSKRKR